MFNNSGNTTCTQAMRVTAWGLLALALLAAWPAHAGNDAFVSAPPVPAWAIDGPVTASRYIKAGNSDAGDRFGVRVALWGDTLVVGAHNEDSNATGVNGDQSDNSAPEAGAVYVYVHDGSDWQFQAYLKGSNSEADDNFGVAVAIQGDTLAVGASGEDSNATGVNGDQSDNSLFNPGAVYVFTRSGGVWTQEAYIKASNTDSGDGFGLDVDLDGDTLAVSAPSEDSGSPGVNGDQSDNSVNNAGAVYVFTRSGTVWTQQAYLKAVNPSAIYSFGREMALSGDTLVAGSRLESSNATGINGDPFNTLGGSSGAAYVFVRSAGVWTQEAYIKASNAGIGDNFGAALDLHGDTLAVGAVREDTAASNGGAVYLFSRTAGVWTEDDILTADLADAEDRFGEYVALHGDALIVGYPREDSAATGIGGDAGNNDAVGAGAARLYTRNAGVWQHTAYLKASNSEAGDSFGWAAAVHGDRVAIAAWDEDSDADGVGGAQSNNDALNAGAVYVFGTGGFSVGGTLHDLAPGTSVVLQNNSGDDLLLSANGAFEFPTGLPDGEGYNVSVLAQPTAPNQNCAVVNGSGTVSGGNVLNIDVFCSLIDYAIGGTITGLAAGNTVELDLNGQQQHQASGNGAFQFDDAIPDGSPYAVTVLSQPQTPPQSCAVENGVGVLAGADVNDVTVVCELASYSVGGTLHDLAPGTSVVLQNNGGDDLLLSANGVFAFATEVPHGGAYSVAVLTQPSAPNQNCAVTNASGTVSGGNVMNIDVFCSPIDYSIGGNIAGLAPGATVELDLNGQQPLLVGGNGVFQFGDAIADGSPYAVTVLTQPSAPVQNCAVQNGVGVLAGADVTDVLVDCVTLTYSIGGSVSGLAPGNDLVLQNNGGDDVLISANGPFAFPTEVLDGGLYNVSVLQQPSGPNQLCSVQNGAGAVAGAPVTDVAVVCVTVNYTIGGEISGLAAGSEVILQNNSGDDLLISANGPFVFSGGVPDGGLYNVTAPNDPSPIGQVCAVSNGSGTVNGANVTDVTVLCFTVSYALAGTVSGLASGNEFVLQNNGAHDKLIDANGVFIHSAVFHGEPYNLTVLTQPNDPNQLCTVVNGSGVMTGQVTDVEVNCETLNYSVGGSVSGLAAGAAVILQNNSGDDLLIDANGAFSFATALPDTSPYSVTVLTQPSGPNQLCTVQNGAGVLAGADVTDVQVDCVTLTYTVGGGLANLASGAEVVLQINGGEVLILSANGAFTFPTALPDGSIYFVEVLEHPEVPVQTCQLFDPVGQINGANVTNIEVICNTAPLAAPDPRDLLEDAVLVAVDVDGTLTPGVPDDDGVLANDSDAEDDALSVLNPGEFTAAGIGGLVVLEADGAFAYTPPADAFGLATVAYQIGDGIHVVDALLEITVLPVNDPPQFEVQDVAVNLFDVLNNPLVVPGFAENLVTGPANEAAQSVINTEILVLSDSQGVISGVQFDLNGDLSVQFSGAFGAALLQATVQDDGGTANGGEDTSAPRAFAVMHTDVLFADGFDGAAAADKAVNDDSPTATAAARLALRCRASERAQWLVMTPQAPTCGVIKAAGSLR